LSIKDQHIKNIFVIFAFINIKFFKHKHLTEKLIQRCILNISMINSLAFYKCRWWHSKQNLFNKWMWHMN
jgi:hypothetical protein